MRNQKSLFLMSFVLTAVLLSAALFGAADPVAGQSDDRLNCDEAAPVVLYCDSEKLEVYWVAGGGSELVLEVPYEELNAIDRPDLATWIAGTANGLVNVYVLDTWEIQVNVNNGDELWVARWWDCPSEPAEVEVYSQLTGERLSWERDTCNGPVDEEEEVLFCEYINPYSEQEGTAACDELCEWDGGVWFCDDLCEGAPCGFENNLG